jgi:phosphatidate phosphatase APP1
LRYFRVQDGSAQAMLGAPEVFKRQSIESLFTDFPRRKFVLVGDTGEKDPEVYGETARRHPDRVRLIALRNITDETASNPRLTAALKDVPGVRVILFRDAGELPPLKDLAK